MNFGTQIIGTGSAFPEKVMTNADFEKFLDTTDDWIRTRTGIETRRICDPKKGETNLSLSIQSARKALEMAKVSADELDMILVATVTPESVLPPTAVLLQAELGANKAFAFDFQAACTGFLYALAIVDNFIKVGKVKKALIMGTEVLSTITNWHDRGTCILFGDGSGAAVCVRTEGENRVLSHTLHSDGRYGDLLKIEHGYTRMPPYAAGYLQEKHKLAMKGREIFKIAVTNMVEASQRMIRESGLTVDDVDMFFFHQANRRIIEACRKAVGVEQEKVWINLDKYGNTSSATIPTCLDEAWRAGAVKSGSVIAMAAFGGGLTWAAGVVRL